MDDVIGGIVYIVIMLAIFIFSAFRKKKEGNENVPESEGGKENPMDEVFQPFKEIFEEDDGETSDEKRGGSVTSHPTKDQGEGGRKSFDGAPFVKEDYVFTSETNPGDKRRQRINQKPGQQTSLKSEQNQPEKQQSGGGAPDWFDLRKAVIFSEILKRPDY